MKTIYILLFTVVISLTTRSQTPLPYYTAFDNVNQRSGWTFYKNAVTQFAEWKYGLQAYTTPTCILHMYPVGGTQMTMDWAVSPGFDFSGGGKIDSLRTNFGGFTSNPPVSDTVAIYLFVGSPNPSLATSKTLLIDFRGINYVSDNTWKTFTNISIPATTGQSYLAFYYKTTASWLDVKFDNLQLSALGSAPTVSFSSVSNVACSNEAIGFNDLSTGAPTAWDWTFAGVTPSVSTIRNPTVSFATAGVYTVSLVSSNSFGAGVAYSQTVNINACTGISSKSKSLDVTIYPNPSNGKFSISSNDLNTMRFTLFNILGETITDGIIEQPGKTTIDISTKPSGIYLIRLESQGISRTVKLLKN